MTLSDNDDRRPLDIPPERGGPTFDDRRLARATWGFVALGVLLRVARYLMDYPLWWDEAFVAVNLIRRGYSGLLLPLDYGQVCPILFLWAELTAVKLLGFSEWSLRLFPLGCALASVLLFRHAAGRVLRGVPLLLAVAIFAVSFHPIRHAADLKPYASDLLAALSLLAAAFEWRCRPERPRWLWVLAALAPFALGLSHPAVFAAGGIGLGLAPAVWKSGRLSVRAAHAAFLVSTSASFLALYAAFTRAQATATLSGMQAQWGAAFPPLDHPWRLLAWLARVHTGGMFAYPCGGENGASTLTLLLFASGAVALWRRGRATVVLACLAPFALALTAAAVRRYPYGGVAHGSAARVMQYLVPAVCLLAAVGASALLARVGNPRTRFRTLRAGLVALGLVGVVPLAVDSFHPYRATHARRARDFARRFWPEFVRGAEPVCLLWDLGLGDWDSINLNVAVYLCNQQIYSPARRRPFTPSLQTASESHPIRCVVPFSDPREPPAADWLDAIKADYRLRSSREVAVDMAEPGARPRVERYHVFKFVPRREALQAALRPAGRRR